MKKVLIVLGCILLFLVIAIVSIPLLFKDKIKAKIDQEIALKVNADVFFDANSFGLTIIKNFPNITVSVANFGVVGKDAFKGDTLIAVKGLDIVVDIMSVINGPKINVMKFALDAPHISALKLKSGQANWDIMKPDTTMPAVGAEKPSSFNVAIKEWSVKDAEIFYADATLPMVAILHKLNHKGSGDFTQDIFDLTTTTTIDNLSIEYDSTSYVSNKKFSSDVALNINMPKSTYTFKDNVFKLNDFSIGFNGVVAMVAEDINTDVTFAVKESTFRSILSLVPGVYTEGFENVKTDGTIAMKGFAKGTYNAKSMPAFGLDMQIDKGQVQYPKLPVAVTNINVDLSVNNPDGNLENTSIDIRKMHLDLGKNPFDAVMKLKGLKRIALDGMVKAKLDLAELTQAVPVAGLTLKGLFSLDAKAKGVYDAATKQMPSVSAKMNMIDGYVKSKDFPAPLENINFSARADNPTGLLKDTKLYIENYKMVLEGEPVTVTAYVENFEDYIYDVKLKGAIDLAKITKIYPVAGSSIAGKLIADIATKGKMSDVTAKRYDKLPTSGTMGLSNFSYVSKDLPQGMKITNAALSFSPQKMTINSFNGFAGTSDIKLEGSVSNYIGYVINQQTLVGNMKLTSNKFDANQWVSKEPTKPTSGPEKPMGVVVVPKNLDLNFVAAITTLVYDNMVLDNVNGKIGVKNGIVNLDNFDFNTLEGNINTTGFYDPTDVLQPKYGLKLGVKDVSVKKAYQTFGMVQKLVPAAKDVDGKVSTNFNISGKLDNNMKPILPTVNGAGMLSLASAAVNNISIIQGINKLARTSLADNVRLQDTKIDAEIKDGRVFFKPFNLTAGSSVVNIGGSQGLDGTLDYNLKTKVEAGALGAAANNAISQLLGKPANNSSSINLNIKVSGTHTNPKYTLVSAGGDDVKTQATTAIKNQIDKVKQEAEAKVRAEAERIRAESEAKVRAESDRLKKEAEDRAKEELNKLKGKFKF